MTEIDFDEQLEKLRELEAKAKTTGLDSYRRLAETLCDTLMSYRGMTGELAAFAVSQNDAFCAKVASLIESKDVEEIYQLWNEYCRGN